MFTKVENFTEGTQNTIQQGTFFFGSKYFSYNSLLARKLFHLPTNLEERANYPVTVYRTTFRINLKRYNAQLLKLMLMIKQIGEQSSSLIDMKLYKIVDFIYDKYSNGRLVLMITDWVSMILVWMQALFLAININLIPFNIIACVYAIFHASICFSKNLAIRSESWRREFANWVDFSSNIFIACSTAACALQTEIAPENTFLRMIFSLTC